MQNKRKAVFLLHREFSSIHRKMWTTQLRTEVLVVMLEVMSRITPAMLGSDFSSSSTLRMEERTVA